MELNHCPNILECVELELCYVCVNVQTVYCGKIVHPKTPSTDTRQYFDSRILRSLDSYFKRKNLHRERVIHERYWNEHFIK